MPTPKPSTVVPQIGYWLLVILVGSLAGGVAGYLAAQTVAGGLDSRLSQLWSRVSTSLVTTSTPSNTNTQIVPLEMVRRPVYPTAFINRSVSPMIPLIRKAGLKLMDPVTLPTERIQGYGVSLTSDGWIVMPASLFTGPLSDLGVVWHSQVYPIKQALRDRLSDLVFVKIDATNLPVTAFVSPVDVVPGLGVWVEREPRQLQPETITATDARGSREMMASERLNRRYQLSFTDALTRAGTPVWSDNGGLVGLILASDQTGTRVIPTSAISSVLSQVLATRPIQRSALGLRVQDVSSLVSEGVRLNWPEQGILVRQVLSTSTAKFLQEGDVIERLDQDSFDGSLDLGERLLDYRPGTSVTIQGIRKGKSFQVDIPLQTTTTGEMLK
jgi:S1-C subfamily serine protease